MPEQTDVIRVAVVGAAGRMGREVCRTLSAASGIEVRVAVDTAAVGMRLQDLVGGGVPDLVVGQRLAESLEDAGCDVLVDFTHPLAAAENALTALDRGVAPVVGTSGLAESDLETLARRSRETSTPALVVPNFAIGAVLMMKFAELAAKWMPDVEIVELHHEQKADAPSGTARSTAARIARARRLPPSPRPEEIVAVEGARGGAVDGVPIHSVRLCGLVAHQMVMFGAQGETLTIRHDSLDRSSFMPGVELCVRGVWRLEGLVVGMDRLLE